MRILEKKIIMALIMTVLPTFCNGILQEQATYDDITQHSEFRCRWYGGSSTRVSCNCMPGSEMVIKQNIPSFSTTEIEITNCKNIIFEQNSIIEMRNLRSIRIQNVESITFQEESISWYGYINVGNHQEEYIDLSIPSIKIHIFNSTITLISSHAFKGRINEVILENVIINKMLSVAFANLLQTERIIIKNSYLKYVALQSFKKFNVKNIKLNGIVVDIIPSRTFSNIIVEKVLIHNCTFGTIHSGAFSISNSNIFQVTNNNIGHLNGEAFKINSKGTVQFKNNTFGIIDDGAFQGIAINKDEVVNNGIFSFESNTVSSITRNSLSLTSINSKFLDIYINKTCNCEGLGHIIKEAEYYEHIKCFYNDSYMFIKDFNFSECSVITNYYVFIIILCITSVLFIVIVSGLVLYYKVVYKSKKYGSKEQNKNGTISLIVPDGRTYRETELHVMVEKNDLLTTDL